MYASSFLFRLANFRHSSTLDISGFIWSPPYCPIPFILTTSCNAPGKSSLKRSGEFRNVRHLPYASEFLLFCCESSASAFHNLCKNLFKIDMIREGTLQLGLQLRPAASSVDNFQQKPKLKQVHTVHSIRRRANPAKFCCQLLQTIHASTKSFIEV